MLNLNIDLTSYKLNIVPEVSYTDSKDTYKILYTSGITDFTTKFTVKYHSYQLVENTLKVPFKNTYLYDDNTSRYYIKYSSGREISDYTTIYRLKYITDNPVEKRSTYKIVFSSEVRLTDIIQTYKLRFTSWGLNDAFSEYNIRYLSIGVGDVDHRKRWGIKYTSQSLGDFATTYKIKYTASVFYDNAIRYLIRYNTQGSEKVLTRAALIKREDGKYDALFQIRGTLDLQMDSYFYVLSNMPKYQHVEYTIGDELPYVDYIKYYEVNDIFNSLDNGRYEVKGYLILKDIDPNNSVSVDAYDIEEYKRANRAKSFFFSLEDNYWEEVDVEFKDRTIKTINYASDNYKYVYLNFVSTEVAPVFNPGETCCFSRKILPPGSPNISGGCSPF